MTEPWQERAACKGCDLDLFFPERGDTRACQEAKAVCSGCQVRRECLIYAMDNNLHFGVWGGSSDRQRRRYRNRPDLLERSLLIITTPPNAA